MICVQFRNLQIRAPIHTQTENTLPTNHKSDNVCASLFQPQTHAAFECEWDIWASYMTSNNLFFFFFLNKQNTIITSHLEHIWLSITDTTQQPMKINKWSRLFV